jgi:hypothetical protein
VIVIPPDAASAAEQPATVRVPIKYRIVATSGVVAEVRLGENTIDIPLASR